MPVFLLLVGKCINPARTLRPGDGLPGAQCRDMPGRRWRRSGAAWPLRFCCLCGPTPPACCPRPFARAALGSFVAGGYAACARPAWSFSPAWLLVRRTSRRRRKIRSRRKTSFAPASGFPEALSPGVRAGDRAGRGSSEPLSAFPVRRDCPRWGPAAPSAGASHPVLRPGPAHFGTLADPRGRPAPLRGGWLVAFRTEPGKL